MSYGNTMHAIHTNLKRFYGESAYRLAFVAEYGDRNEELDCGEESSGFCGGDFGTRSKEEEEPDPSDQKAWLAYQVIVGAKAWEKIRRIRDGRRISHSK